MRPDEKEEAIVFARAMVAGGASRGRVKKSLVDRFGLAKNVAGRIVRTAVHQLYGDSNQDLVFWLAQDCGSSTPLQRRYARRRYRALSQERQGLSRARER
jgi:hypothetical protein